MRPAWPDRFWSGRRAESRRHVERRLYPPRSFCALSGECACFPEKPDRPARGPGGMARGGARRPCVQRRWARYPFAQSEPAHLARKTGRRARAARLDAEYAGPHMLILGAAQLAIEDAQLDLRMLDMQRGRLRSAGALKGLEIARLLQIQ